MLTKPFCSRSSSSRRPSRSCPDQGASASNCSSRTTPPTSRSPSVAFGMSLAEVLPVASYIPPGFKQVSAETEMLAAASLLLQAQASGSLYIYRIHMMTHARDTSPINFQSEQVETGFHSSVRRSRASSLLACLTAHLCSCLSAFRSRFAQLQSTCRSQTPLAHRTRRLTAKPNPCCGTTSCRSRGRWKTR